jgi:hypothetical protein
VTVGGAVLAAQWTDGAACGRAKALTEVRKEGWLWMHWSGEMQGDASMN